jgi:hypothetical protein
MEPYPPCKSEIRNPERIYYMKKIFAMTVLSVYVFLGTNLAIAGVNRGPYADFMSYSSNFVLVQLHITVDGKEIPIEKASVVLNGSKYHPASYMEERGKKIPTGIVEVGENTFSVDYEGKTVTKIIDFKPIMQKEDCPKGLEILNKNGYEMNNVLRISFEL